MPLCNYHALSSVEKDWAAVEGFRRFKRQWSVMELLRAQGAAFARHAFRNDELMRTSFFPILAVLVAFPAIAGAKDFEAGDRVLVKGRFQRKCSARIDSIPAPGFFRLSFDRPGCGDAGQPFERRQLQALRFVEESKVAGVSLKAGDDVVLEGFHARPCSGRVKEITRSGYVALDYDSLLCADTETLRKASELKKISFVSEASQFAVGQRVSVAGILENESCAGTIKRLTDNGLASIQFEQLTCAFADKLYSLGELKRVIVPSAKRRQASGDQIFQQVMREIASSKLSAKKAATKSARRL